MKILILENCFEPNKKTPDIFRKGETKELSDNVAQILIDKGVASAVTPAKSEKPEGAPKKKKLEDIA